MRYVALPTFWLSGASAGHEICRKLECHPSRVVVRKHGGRGGDVGEGDESGGPGSHPEAVP
jgi:hypothetical protein